MWSRACRWTGIEVMSLDSRRDLRSTRTSLASHLEPVLLLLLCFVHSGTKTVRCAMTRPSAHHNFLVLLLLLGRRQLLAVPQDWWRREQCARRDDCPRSAGRGRKALCHHLGQGVKLPFWSGRFLTRQAATDKARPPLCQEVQADGAHGNKMAT